MKHKALMVGFIVFIGAFFMVAGCNSSSDSNDGALTSSLSGDYLFCVMGEDYSSRINSSFDGNGTASYTIVADSDGATGSGTFTYSVASDGIITAEGTEQGIMSPDSSVLALVDTDAGDSDLSFKPAVKKSSGMSNADLNGDYVTYGWIYDSGSRIGSATVTFNGDGTGSNAPFSYTYSVADDGAFTLNGEEGGMVSSDGSVFVLTETGDTISGDLSLYVGVKKSSGMSNANVDGDYVLCDWGYDGSSHWSGLLDISCDGSGTLTYTTISDSDGSTDSGSLTYSVAADGIFSLNGEACGIVSPDGSIIVFADTDDSDNEISYKIIIKKS